MLLLKQNKFGQFLGSIEGINTKTLSIRLRELEDFDLIKRTIIKSRPVQTEYSLTDKGMALEPILAQHSLLFLQDMNLTLFLTMEDQGIQLSKFSELNVCQKFMIIETLRV